MTDFSAFAKLMPGFDLMQGLAQNTNAALPGFGQWVAPTLDPAELDKRIGELRTVQFWLEQNVRMVDATIRGLEVQRMTLSTLQSMNVRTEELRDALKIPMPAGLASAPAAPAGIAAAPAGGLFGPATAAASGSTAAVDPLKWWGALTEQFAALAANAMKEAGTAPAPEAGGRKSAGRKTTGTGKDAAGRSTGG